MSYPREEPYDYPEYSCCGCDDREMKLREIKYWLRHTLDHLYGVIDFDAVQLENCLDELCAQLNMQLPHIKLSVIAKPFSKVTPLLQEWMDHNNTYLKDLTTL